MKKQHKDFVTEYLANGYNATAAYMSCYPDAKRNTARMAGSKLLQRDDVRGYIRDLQKEQVEQQAISAERILLKLSEIAFSDKDDADYLAKDKLKALELLQKQLNLITQNVSADVRGSVVFIDDITED